MLHKKLPIIPVLIALIGLSIGFLPATAQQHLDTAKHKILLIPFKPTMLMSEIGKAINKSTQLSYPKITTALRSALDLALLNTLKQQYLTVSLIQSPKKGDTALAYIYSSVGYKYEIQPGDSSGESHAEFDTKLQKQHFIKNGQLQVPIDLSKRFMNVDIVNPKLLSYLHKKQGADLFIFINELDIRNVANEGTVDLTASNYRRLIVAHYSIVNLQTQYIAKGILTTYFPNNVNIPKTIGETYFTIIARDMLKELNKGLAKPQPKKTTHQIIPLSNKK